jgi:hypothetical protein
MFDSTNNSAFAGVLAARPPGPAVNWLIAVAITNALSHAAQPTPMPIAIGGLKGAVRRWTLSKSELVETIAAELCNNSLRIARIGTGRSCKRSSRQWSEAHRMQRCDIGAWLNRSKRPW